MSQTPLVLIFTSIITTMAISILCMTKVMQEGRSDCWPYIVRRGREREGWGTRAVSSAIDQCHQLWNRTEQNTLQTAGGVGGIHFVP